MPGMLRSARALASLLVVFGLLGATWPTCVEGAIATPSEQMVCCQAGHEHCPMKDSASDCCKKSGVQIESQGTIAKIASLTARSPIVLTWVAVPDDASTAGLPR